MDVRALLRRHRDLVLGVALVPAYALELALWEPARQTLAIPLATAACLLLTLRRRLPVLAFVLVMVSNLAVIRFAPRFDSNSILFVFVFVFSLWSVGRHARGLEAWLGAAAMMATVVTFVIGDGAHAASDIVFALAFVGAPWGAGVAVRLRREREEVLTARNEQLRLEQEENARRAVAVERARIARELHDVVSHAIAVTVLQARGARKMLGVDDDAVRRSLDAIEQTNTGALGDMRRLLAVLRDTETDGDLAGETTGGRAAPQPSLANLDTLVDQVRASGLDVDVSVSGHATAVPPGLDLSAYRIIQEALTNVLKHAGPSARAQVRVSYGEQGVAIEITDDGTLRGNGSSGGHGLIGMRERVAVVGGTVDAGPGESGGFAVRAQLPYSVDA